MIYKYYNCRKFCYNWFLFQMVCQTNEKYAVWMEIVYFTSCYVLQSPTSHDEHYTVYITCQLYRDSQKQLSGYQ